MLLRTRRAVAVSVISDLMIVPNWDPVVFLWVSVVLSGGAREHRDIVSVPPICLNGLGKSYQGKV